jgi:hypothetical protein
MKFFRNSKEFLEWNQVNRNIGQTRREEDAEF